MFRHVALLKWKKGTTEAQVAEWTAALKALPAVTPEIRSYTFGTDISTAIDGPWDYAVVADFDDEAGWLTYRASPGHVAVGELIRPIREDLAIVQFEMK
jgi:hypothetical protein